VHSCPSVCCSLNEALDDEDPIDRNSSKEALPSMAKDIPFGGNYWLLGSTRRKAHGMTVASTALKRRPYRRRGLVAEMIVLYDPCFLFHDQRSLLMTRRHSFHQLDVFTGTPYKGNPLAVVHDAQKMSDEEMASFARWTNLSETTFLMPPHHPDADYRVRIFTPAGELPFAGHPTLGSCHAWLAAGGAPRQSATVVQECGIGLVRIRRDGSRLAFAAPPLRRSGPLDPGSLQRICMALGLSGEDIVSHQWVDNGPGWCALMLHSAQQVLAVRPDWTALGDFKVGIVGPHAQGSDSDFEVRAFVPSLGIREDPVTGSLNAGLAQWLIGAGLAADSYVVRQGSALGRAGKVFLDRLGDDIWVGGEVVRCIEGTVEFPAD
jgi:PhzF family phenazine biosynthesis protein